MFIIYHPRATYVNRMARELGVTSHWPNHNRAPRIRRGHMSVVVNWGCSRPPLFTIPMLNEDIRVSISKLRTFDAINVANIHGNHISIPRVVTDPRTIVDGEALYLRGKYLGRKDGLTHGAGIVVYNRGELPTQQHDFYTQVVSKAFEVRIHIADGRVITEQVKYIPAGSNVLIRSVHNGASFSTKVLDPVVGVENAARAREIAIASIAAIGLNFGAVDMALTRRGEWIVFEVNSAPGLSQRDDDGVEHDMPSTYEAYLSYFRTFKE